MFKTGGLIYIFGLFVGSDVEVGQALRCEDEVFGIIWGIVGELEGYWLVYGMGSDYAWEGVHILLSLSSRETLNRLLWTTRYICTP